MKENWDWMGHTAKAIIQRGHFEVLKWLILNNYCTTGYGCAIPYTKNVHDVNQHVAVRLLLVTWIW